MVQLKHTLLVTYLLLSARLAFSLPTTSGSLRSKVEGSLQRVYEVQNGFTSPDSTLLSWNMKREESDAASQLDKNTPESLHDWKSRLESNAEAIEGHMNKITENREKIARLRDEDESANQDEINALIQDSDQRREMMVTAQGEQSKMQKGLNTVLDTLPENVRLDPPTLEEKLRELATDHSWAVYKNPADAVEESHPFE